MKSNAREYALILCVESLNSFPSPGKLLGDILQLLASAVAVKEADFVGNVHFSHQWRKDIIDDGGKSERAPIIRPIKSLPEQERLSFMTGVVWYRGANVSIRRPKQPPIEFQYQSAEPDRADVGRHAMMMLSMSAELFHQLPWEKVAALLRGIVETIELHVSGIVSLFVECASKGKHDRGHSYGFTINPAEDVQFRLDQQLWRSAARDGQLKLRGVHWGNYLSPQHLAVIPDAAALPARLARWDGDPEGPRIDCKCWPTPGGGLWIELFECPCHWPNAQPRTRDHNAVRTTYNELYRAGFFNWRAAQVRR
jgi:hypothetical protein